MFDFFESCIELPELGYYDYDWNQFISYYDPKANKFYWADSAGCSCHDFWDDFNAVGDFRVGNKNEYLKAAAEYSKGHCGDMNAIRQAVFDLGKKK